MACTGIARPIVTGVPCGLVKKGSLLAVDPVQSIGHDQLLLRDSYAPHYTTAEWSGFEHLLKDQKTTVGTLRTPRAGRCWLFDGTNDYGLGLQANGTVVTLSAWIKGNPTNSVLFAGSTLAAGYAFYFNGSGISFYAGSGSTFNLTYSVPTSGWNHYACVRNGTSVTVYLNGASIGSGTIDSTGWTLTDFSAVRLNAVYALNGSAKDIRSYSVAKSAAEILAIYNQASTPGIYDTTGLVCSYWCEEEKGTTGYDWSGNGYHLTLTNITQSTFHASDTGVNYSSANVDGFTQQRNIIAVESQTFNSASWFANDCTVTANVTTGPTGQANADRLVFSGAACQRLTRFNPLDGGSAITGTYVFSVYLKADSPMTFYIWAFDAGGTNKTVTCNLTTSWQRFEVYMTFTGNGDQRLALFADGLGAITVYAADAQCELGTTATTFQSGGTNNTMIVPKVTGSSNDVLARTLQYTGKCPQPGYAPQKVATFDGTNDYASLNDSTLKPTGDYTVSVWVKCASWAANTNTAICGAWLSNGYMVLITYPSFRIYRNSSFAARSLTLTNDQWVHLSFVASGTTGKFYVNGVLDGSASIGISSQSTVASAFEVAVYSNVGSGFFSGSMSDLRLYGVAKSDAEVLAIKRGTQDTTSLLGQWPMCEGPGSGNTNTTIYDVSGNGKHLTITNATISSFWANASTYDSCIPNHPLKYGYTIDGSGVVVPAKLDGLLDAAGNAIGTAAGKWKSGLPNVNCLPYTNPLGVNIGLETALDPTADRKTTSSSKRRRRNSSGLYDRIGARATAMSDSTSNTYFGD